VVGIYSRYYYESADTPQQSSMHYTSPLQSELNRMIQDKLEPNVELRRNQRLAEKLEINDSNFEDLVASYSHQTSPKQETYAKTNHDHWRIILLNLCRSTVMRQWCGIPGDTYSFKEGGFNHFIGLTSARRTQEILNGLNASNLLIKVKGKAYYENPQVNLYWPTYELQQQLYQFGLFTESLASFDRELIRINEPEDLYKDFVFQDPNQDYRDICAINEFAKTHQWACKAAITWPFKYNPFTSGRLITPFQNLPSREYKIRINTKINDNSIAEVDFNANHLRIFLAFNKTELIGSDDAYEAIAYEADVDRNIVKGFINVALNTDSFESAKWAASTHHRITHKDSRAVSEAFNRVYKGLNLFCGFGLTAMQCEGLVMRKVLMQGITDNVIALPIHDAIAVEFDNQFWAKELMEDAWRTVMSEFHLGASTFTKISFTS
jgi:hypothetical protein